MRAFKYISLIFTLLTWTVKIAAQNSKSIPHSEHTQENLDLSNIMFVCVKIPNNMIAINDISGDSTNSKVNDFIKSYTTIFDKMKDGFVSNEFQKIIVTRENYYLLTPEQQVQLKTFLEIRNHFFQRQLTIGLLSPNHYVLNEKDFEEITKYTTNK